METKPFYNDLIIFYFSGTGNAKLVSEWICEEAKSNNVKAEIVNIATITDIKWIEIPETALLGFCYPTHGFNCPPNIIKFLRKFPKGNNDVFVLNTRAGMKLSKIFLPGISGLALYLPLLLLQMKGFKISGFRSSDMPSNWVSLHPGLKNKVVVSIVSHCHKTIIRFTRKILNRRKVLNGLVWLTIDILISPIAIAYFFFGRFALAKTFYANYNCNSCGLCVKNCPVKAIRMKANRPYWTFNCESCMKCMNACPVRAIETAHGITAVVWWLVFSLIPINILNLLSRFKLIDTSFLKNNFEWMDALISFGLGAVIIYLAYKALHTLLGYRLFNRLITYTSLTHYSFWRRYNYLSGKKKL